MYGMALCTVWLFVRYMALGTVWLLVRYGSWYGMAHGTVYGSWYGMANGTVYGSWYGIWLMVRYMALGTVYGSWYGMALGTVWLMVRSDRCTCFGLWPVPRTPAKYIGLTSCTVTRMCRVSQNPIHTVYIRYFWQGDHQIYGHIRSIYTVLANPTHVRYGAVIRT